MTVYAVVPTLITAATRTFYYHVKVSGVVIVWLGRDARHRLILEPLRLFDDALWEWCRHVRGRSADGRGCGGESWGGGSQRVMTQDEQESWMDGS
jgi:hypothetical protein